MVVAILWLQAYPLPGVAVLTALCVAVALFLVPHLDEATRHGHPRC